MAYATLAEVRAEGVTVAQADDARVTALLTRASRYIDDMTGWWFDARSLTLTLDGTGGELLWLTAPPITLASVTLDDEALTLSDVLVYGQPTDSLPNRQNPRLARVYSALWTKGRRNVVVAGSFGRVEADGASPPPEIKDVCLRLVWRHVPRLTDAAGQSGRNAGSVYRETTDGHSYERAGGMPGGGGSWRFNGPTGDPDIDTVLIMYRRPPFGGLV